MPPAQRVQARDIHQLARSAVGFRSIEDELAFEAENARDRLGQLADGDIFPRPDVDEGREVLCE